MPWRSDYGRAMLPLPLIVSSLLVARGARSPVPVAWAPATPITTSGGADINSAPAGVRPLVTRTDIFFVNTHVRDGGEIESTNGFILFDPTVQQLSEYPADTCAPIVLYCRGGARSAGAAALVQAGYTNVRHLDGGILAWEVADYPLRRRSMPHLRHPYQSRGPC